MAHAALDFSVHGFVQPSKLADFELPWRPMQVVRVSKSAGDPVDLSMPTNPLMPA